jgi:hypothetical protein
MWELPISIWWSRRWDVTRASRLLRTWRLDETSVNFNEALRTLSCHYS